MQSSILIIDGQALLLALTKPIGLVTNEDFANTFVQRYTLEYHTSAHHWMFGASSWNIRQDALTSKQGPKPVAPLKQNMLININKITINMNSCM